MNQDESHRPKQPTIVYTKYLTLPERDVNAFLHVMLATIHKLLVVDPDVRRRDRVMFIDLLASILF